MTDWTPKTFTVTVTGNDWQGQPIAKTVTVCTHGDAEQAKYVVVTRDYPVQVVKADPINDWKVERVA